MTDVSAAPEKISRQVLELARFLTEYMQESDRSAAIIGAARLDQQLYQILSRVLLPCSSSQDELLDGGRPLHNFGPRIELTYRLGLISADLARALHLVKRIRNKFAHELSGSSLNSGSHRDRVHELVRPFKKWGLWISRGRVFENNYPDEESTDFRFAVAIISSRLSEVLFKCEPLDGSGSCGIFPPGALTATPETKADHHTTQQLPQVHQDD